MASLVEKLKQDKLKQEQICNELEEMEDNSVTLNEEASKKFEYLDFETEVIPLENEE